VNESENTLQNDLKNPSENSDFPKPFDTPEPQKYQGFEALFRPENSLFVTFLEGS